jgi:hypothetical protein
MIEIKNLIACGCSFTKGHLLSRDQTWPSHVAKKQNWNCYNIAEGGMGNEWISRSVIGYLEKNKHLKNNSIVIIAWSEIGRQLGLFQPDLEKAPERVSIRPDDFVKDDFKKHWSTDIKKYSGYTLKYGSVLRPFFSNYLECIVKTYSAIFNLKTYLEKNNIPYLFFDALSDNKILNLVDTVNNIYDVVIKDSYGVPIKISDYMYPDMNDYLTKEFMNSIFDEKYITFNNNSMLLEMRMKDYDRFTEGNEGHPNIYACDYFSDLIIKEIKEQYYE